MTKNFLMFICFSTATLYGMEPIQDCITEYFPYKNTAIYVTTESLFQVDRYVNCMVVGYHEQNMLRKDKSHKKNNLQPGYVYECCHRNMYQKNRYKDNSCKLNLTISRRFLLRAVEPCIIQEKSKKHKKEKCDLEAAKKQLDSCYGSSLHLYVFIHNMMDDVEDEKNKHEQNRCFPNTKTIAFANLGVAVGFPKKEAAAIAVTRIRKFIRKYPNVYDTIYFIVETNDDIALYKEVFEKKAWERIFLLVYHGPQDEKSVFSWLPQEIIMKILYLIK